MNANLPSPLAEGAAPQAVVIVAWPASLPQCADSYAEQGEPVIVRTNVEEGAPKVRRRFTKRLLRAQVGMTMRIDQRNILDSFFLASLDGGVNVFTFKHPWTAVTAYWRMAEAPQFSNIGPLGVAVSMVWEDAS